MDFNEILAQAQQVQAGLEKAQQELSNMEFTAASGGGVVEATVSGKGTLLSLTISPDAVDPEDVEMLQDLVVSAVNGAMNEAMKTANSRMESAAGGMAIPGLFG